MENKKMVYGIVAIIVVGALIGVALYFKDSLPTSQNVEGNATVNNQKEMKTNLVNGNNNTIKSVEGDVNAGGDVSF